jgi:hypothetical protein
MFQQKQFLHAILPTQQTLLISTPNVIAGIYVNFLSKKPLPQKIKTQEGTALQKGSEVNKEPFYHAVPSWICLVSTQEPGSYHGRVDRLIKSQVVGLVCVIYQAPSFC